MCSLLFGGGIVGGGDVVALLVKVSKHVLNCLPRIADIRLQVIFDAVPHALDRKDDASKHTFGSFLQLLYPVTDGASNKSSARWRDAFLQAATNSG